MLKDHTSQAIYSLIRRRGQAVLLIQFGTVSTDFTVGKKTRETNKKTVRAVVLHSTEKGTKDSEPLPTWLKFNAPISIDERHILMLWQPVSQYDYVVFDNQIWTVKERLDFQSKQALQLTVVRTDKIPYELNAVAGITVEPEGVS